MTILSRRSFVWMLFGLLSVLGLTLIVRAAPPVFDPVAETEKLLNTMPAEARAKSDAYFEGGYWLQLWDQALTLGFYGILLGLGIVQRFRNWAESAQTVRRLLGVLVFLGAWGLTAVLLKVALPAGDGWWMLRFVVSPVFGGVVAFVLLRERIVRWLQRPGLHHSVSGVYFFLLVTMTSWIVTMPWGLYVGYYREHAYGLSNLSLGEWFAESIKGQVIFILFFSFLGAMLYGAIRRWPAGWWVRAAITTPFLLFLVIVIAPVFIAPVFNTYAPLKDPKVRDPILSLARANGVPVEHVYEFDASKQSKRISANVSGAFGTIRVSLNDNLLNRCTPGEVMAVMGHELGHYVLNHVYKLVISQTLMFAGVFAFMHWFTGATHRRWGARLGVRGIGDFASLPLLLAGMSLATFLLTPVRNSLVRTTESEADIFGLNAAREPDGFATTALKLSEYRKLAPGKWEEIVFFDHPSGYQRILMAMRWKAEHQPEVRMPDRPAEKR